jgi:hypothetical protein
MLLLSILGQPKNGAFHVLRGAAPQEAQSFLEQSSECCLVGKYDAGIYRPVLPISAVEDGLTSSSSKRLIFAISQ